MARAPVRDKSGLVKGSWTPEEDQKLIAYISRFGIWNWTEMPKHAGLSRSGKSCRLRWMNYLRPGVRRGNITKEEEEIIFSLHKLLGNNNSSKDFRKNHWYTYLKKRSNHNLELSTEVNTSDGETNEINTSDGEANEINNIVENVINVISPPAPMRLDSPSIDHCSSPFRDSPPAAGFDEIQTIEHFQCFWTEPFVLDWGRSLGCCI